MRRKDFPTALLFLLPALLIIAIFRFYPILQAIRMSFYKWGLAGALQFIGLHNFFRLFIDPKFYQSLGNTFWYVIFTVPLTIMISVGLAYLLNQRIKGQGVYRTLFYLPVVTSIVASSVVWKWIFNPDRGVLNAIIGLVGIEPMQWLNDPRGLFQVIVSPLHIGLVHFLAGPSFALVALIIMSVWHNVGYCIIIALAGLQNIPEQYYEAARIDGASGWSIFRHVTIPVLSPTIFYLLVTQTIIAFNTFTSM
jgi:multiple sugar transport system permease protein